MANIENSPEKKRPTFGRLKRVLSAVAFVLLVMSSTGIKAQTDVVPPPINTSCTSKDLSLVGVRVDIGSNPCSPTLGLRNLKLKINNGTKSERTSFALWATLVTTKQADNSVISTKIIFACGGPIGRGGVYEIDTEYFLEVKAGENYELKDLFLAWTTSNDNETCAFLKANSANINPKCGTLPSIKVDAGLTAEIQQPTATQCSGTGTSGTVKVKPYGGTGPYTVSMDNGTPVSCAVGATVEFAASAGQHSFLIKDNTTPTKCEKTVNYTVNAPGAVTANAGDDFTKTCVANANGKLIGAAKSTGFTYSWEPSTGLSGGDGLTPATSANPFANPLVTTTYTLTVTNTETGCVGKDQVVVTVDKPTVVAEAGSAFTKTCLANTQGKAIGEADDPLYSYSWSPTSGLSASNVSNPTANPSSTTTYTVTKTHRSSGCYNTDQVIVTVNTAAPTFTVAVTNPTLCANSGSVTFTPSGGSGFQYSIDNGATWGNSATIQNLGSGSVTGFKVKNSDGCVSLGQDCAPPSPPAPVEKANTSFSTVKETEDGITVKAFPNPFSSTLNFAVKSPIAGFGSIDLYNMQGQKLATIFQGRIPMGTSNYQHNVQATTSASNLIWVLRVGNKTINGKVLSIKR